jgi:hypothetical protein
VEKKINMVRHSVWPLLSLICLLSDCTGTGTPIPTLLGPTITLNTSASSSPTPFGPILGTPSITATTPVSVLTQAPTTDFSSPLYTLNAALNYADHSLSINERISYQNATGEILYSIVLAVEPNIWKGCFILEGMVIGGQEVTKTEMADNRLEVSLPIPLIPGATLEMQLQYDLHLPPANSHHIFGYNLRQVNLVDWYPFIVPYSGGWVLHPPAEVGEHLVYDLASFDVTINLAETNLPVTLAASSPAEIIAGGWHYYMQNSRTFVLSASTSFQSVSKSINGMAVTSYYFSDDELQARVVLDEVAKALVTFTELFGTQSHPGLNIVESPFFDGMEYDGLFFLSQNFYTAYDGTVLNNLIDIAVHETAHQWWFGMVGSDQALAPWLDEALATYSEELFYEKNHPDVTNWWFFRVDSFSPSGKVDIDVYHGGNFRAYANAIYLRGAQFLGELRGRIGDSAFFAFLKDYTAQMAGKQATAEDFFRILREHTNADLSDIISKYFQYAY